jgi:hypothetical protein
MDITAEVEAEINRGRPSKSAASAAGAKAEDGPKITVPMGK